MRKFHRFMNINNLHKYIVISVYLKNAIVYSCLIITMKKKSTMPYFYLSATPVYLSKQLEMWGRVGVK